jgi:hypothetical protein
MFQHKLIKALQRSTAWIEIANALETLSDQVLEPTLDRLKKMTSVFTMHEDDLQVRFNELGAIISIGITQTEDIPLLLQQRTDEVHYKGYEYTLTKTFEREFLSVSPSWQQMLAPKDLITYPYGEKFILKSDLDREGVNASDYFSTYRGVIYSDLNKVYGSFEGGIEEFESTLKRVILPLIPTHIAYYGQLYALTATVYTPHYKINSIALTTRIEDVTPQQMIAAGKDPVTHFLVGFDEFALDSIPLEINQIQENW